MRKTNSNDFYHSVLGGGTGADPRADGLSLTMSGCALAQTGNFEFFSGN